MYTRFIFGSVYRQYTIQDNENLSVKIDDNQYRYVDGKMISNQSSKASSSQSKSIDI
jgi:hypothetical protein